MLGRLRAGESWGCRGLVDLEQSHLRFGLELFEVGTGDSPGDFAGKLPLSEMIQHRGPFRNSRYSCSSVSFDCVARVRFSSFRTAVSRSSRLFNRPSCPTWCATNLRTTGARAARITGTEFNLIHAKLEGLNRPTVFAPFLDHVLPVRVGVPGCLGGTRWTGRCVRRAGSRELADLEGSGVSSSLA
jgi:hypothetical protein